MINGVVFKGFKVLNLSLKTEQTGLSDSFRLGYQAQYPAQSERDFVVRFEAEIAAKAGVLIQLDYAGFFESPVPITAEFREGPFPAVNAPAITYPYLRSFITTLTANAGIQPIILPILNLRTVVKSNIILPKAS